MFRLLLREEDGEIIVSKYTKFMGDSSSQWDGSDNVKLLPY